MNEALQSLMDRRPRTVRRVQMHRFDLPIQRPTSLRFPLFVLRRGSPTTHLSARLFTGLEFLNLVLDGCKAHARIIRRALPIVKTSSKTSHFHPLLPKSTRASS